MTLGTADIIDLTGVTAILDANAGGSTLTASIAAGTESTAADLLTALSNAIAAAATASNYRSMYLQMRAHFRAAMVLACEITTNEVVRKDFEENVANKLMTKE